MKKLTLFLILISLVMMPVLTLAVSHNPFTKTGGGIKEVNNLTVDSIFKLLSTLLNWASALIVLMATAMLLYAGFLFIKGGDDDIKAAKNYIIYGIIGLVVSGLAWGVGSLVNNFLGNA